MSEAEIYALPWIHAGVARLKSTRLGYDLDIGPYAGTLVVGETTIEVNELVEGTVAACLEISHTGRLMGEQTVQRGRTISPNGALAGAYVAALREALAAGVSKEYVDRRILTSRPRGKVLVSATVRGPWARGDARHVVAKVRPLTEDTETNRLLLAGAVRAQYLLRDEPDLLRELRGCLMMLSGAALVANPTSYTLTNSADGSTRRALAIASNLVQGVPAIPKGEGRDPGAFTAWINVERVFEEAMLSLCDRLQPLVAQSGRTLNVDLFTSLPGDAPHIRKRAEPDIVVQGYGKTFVLDAKYRRSGDKPSEADIYQLMAHSTAFGADASALITPALYGPPRIEWLGRAPDGFSVDVIAVDPRDTRQTEDLLAEWFETRSAYNVARHR